MRFKKCLLSLGIVVCSIYFLFSQESKFRFAIEYSPNYSIITDAYVHEKFKLSHNVFLKSEYILKEKLNLTIGLGFFNTGEKEVSDIGGQLGIEEISFIHDYNYIMISPGLKFKIKSYFINPEIGLGINILHQTKQIIKYSSGKEEVKKEEEKLISGGFNKLSLPLLLTLGKEIPFRKINLLIGIKAYFSINEVVSGVPRNNHYYGIGIMAGLKF